jgi:hypothetical protein
VFVCPTRTERGVFVSWAARVCQLGGATVLLTVMRS